MGNACSTRCNESAAPMTETLAVGSEEPKESSQEDIMKTNEEQITAQLGAPSPKAKPKMRKAQTMVMGDLFDRCETAFINPISIFDELDHDQSGMVLFSDLMDMMNKRGVDTAALVKLFASTHVGGFECVSRDDFLEALVNRDAPLVLNDNRVRDRIADVVHRQSNSLLKRMGSAALETDFKAQYVGIIAHNNMKIVMAQFVEEHVALFGKVKIVTTGTTGTSLEEKLGIRVGHKVASGPLGGDAEIAQLVVQDKVSAIFFFRDPLSSHPHSMDIQALTRLRDVYRVPYATNVSSGHALVMAIQTWGHCDLLHRRGGRPEGLSEKIGTMNSIERIEGGDVDTAMLAYKTGEQFLQQCENSLLQSDLILGLADVDHSRQIDYSRFQALLQRFQLNVDSSPLFDHLDPNGVGYVEADELKLFVGKCAQRFANKRMTCRMTSTLSEKSNHLSVWGDKHQYGSSDKYVLMDCQPGSLKSMVMFVKANRHKFQDLKLACTQIVSRPIMEQLTMPVGLVLFPGPLGGYQEIGAMVSRKEVAAVISFQDPLGLHGHSHDIMACWRLCDVHQVPYATNASTAIALLFVLSRWGECAWYAPNEEGAIASYKDVQLQALNKVLQDAKP